MLQAGQGDSIFVCLLFYSNKPTNWEGSGGWGLWSLVGQGLGVVGVCTLDWGPPDHSAHPALQQSKPGSNAQVTGPNVVGREWVMADVRASEAHGPADVPLVAAGWDRQPGRGLKHL